MRWALLLASLLLAGPAFGASLTYLDDDFLPDEDMNGWTPYAGPYGSETITNPPGTGFDLSFTPSYLRLDEQVGIAGFERGGGCWGDFGIYKQYTDQDVEGGVTKLRVWVRMLTCDWGWVLSPAAITVGVGVDPNGGTDATLANIVWGDEYWGGWELREPYELEVGELSGQLTVFIDFQGFNSGYSEGLIDRVLVFEEGASPADLDQDADVDLDDLATFDGCFGQAPPEPVCEIADIEGDNDVDCSDWQTMYAHWTGGEPPMYENCPCFGRTADIDCDGDVDSDDLNTLDFCYTGSGNPMTGSCERADIDGDNDVDCLDYRALVEAWTGPPQDPPSLAQCESIGCPLTNGGFESGDLTGWTDRFRGWGRVETEDWYCGYGPGPGLGEYYFGVMLDPYVPDAGLYHADVIAVTDPGGTSLSVDFSCYYQLSLVYETGAHPDEVHMVWEIGYRDDQRPITNDDDPCLTWVEILNTDASVSTYGSGWCDTSWVYTGPVRVDIEGLPVCVAQVVLRMRAWVDEVHEGYWAFALVDEVECCVTGLGGGCPTHSPADLDQDGDTDQDDINTFAACFARPPDRNLLPGCELADLDCDNNVGCNDWDMMKASWQGAPPADLDCACDNPAGDLDCDGDVDDDDVGAFESCFGTVPGELWTPCGLADIDCDDDIDCVDYGNLRSGYILDQGADPGLIPQCPWCDTPLSNRGFESGTFAPEWLASGAGVRLSSTEYCKVSTPFGQYFAGDYTSTIPMDWTIRRIIETEAAGGDSLDVELRAFYYMTAAAYLGGAPGSLTRNGLPRPGRCTGRTIAPTRPTQTTLPRRRPMNWRVTTQHCR